MRLLGLGDNVCDVYLNKEIMYPGGQALNVSVYARMLGVQSEYMGIFGNDDIAAHIRKTLDKIGVPHPNCITLEGENGFARVSIIDGDRVFMGSNKGGIRRLHPVELTAKDLEYIDTFTFVHTSNNSYIDKELPKLKDRNTLLSYDISNKWTDKKRLEYVSKYADVIFMSCSDTSEDDIATLTDAVCSGHTSLAVATRGAKGTIVFDGSSSYIALPHYVEAIDTLGAGDSFAASLLVSLGNAIDRDGMLVWGKSEWLRSFIDDALDAASVFSAKTCMTEGAFGHGAPIPDRSRYRMLHDDHLI